MAIWPAAGQEILENLKTAGQIGIGGRLPAAGQIATAIFNTPLNRKTCEWNLSSCFDRNNAGGHEKLMNTISCLPEKWQPNSQLQSRINRTLVPEAINSTLINRLLLRPFSPLNRLWDQGKQAKTSDSKRQLDTNDHSDESRKRSQTTNEDSRRLLDIYDHSKDSKNDHKRFKAYERRLQNITPNDGSEDARMTPSDQKRNVVMHDIRTVCRYPKALQTHKHTHIQIDFESGILKA